MLPIEFSELLTRRLQKTQSTLDSKSKEYAADDDKLYNFKRTAEIKRESIPKALWGMSAKHLTAVIDMVEGKLPATQHNVDEKIGDLINYLILLEAVFADQAQKVSLTKELTKELDSIQKEIKNGRSKSSRK